MLERHFRVGIHYMVAFERLKAALPVVGLEVEQWRHRSFLPTRQAFSNLADEQSITLTYRSQSCRPITESPERLGVRLIIKECLTRSGRIALSYVKQPRNAKPYWCRNLAIRPKGRRCAVGDAPLGMWGWSARSGSRSIRRLCRLADVARPAAGEFRVYGGRTIRRLLNRLTVEGVRDKAAAEHLILACDDGPHRLRLR